MNEQDDDPDDIRPVCRQYYASKTCRLGDRCRWKHADPSSLPEQKEVKRPLNRCYCGSGLKRIPNTWMQNYDDDGNPTGPVFYTVCGRTNRSKKWCM